MKTVLACLIVLCIFSFIVCSTYPSTSGGGNTKITSIATSESEAKLSRSTVAGIIKEYLSQGGYFLDTKISKSPLCDPLININSDAMILIQEGLLDRYLFNIEKSVTDFDKYTSVWVVWGEMLSQNYSDMCTLTNYIESQSNTSRYVIWVPPNCFDFSLDRIESDFARIDVAVDQYRHEELLSHMTFEILTSALDDDWLGNWQVFWSPMDSEESAVFIVDDNNRSVIYSVIPSSIKNTICDF